jgi:hypothetical protein
MTTPISEKRMLEIRAVADAVSESVVAVEMAARKRRVRQLEAKVRKGS